MPRSQPINTATVKPIQRVAYIVHTFDMGGLERCIARLANHLDRERFAPMVICLNRSGDAANWITRDDVPIVELHKRPGNDPGVIRRFARVLREHNVEIVHSHNWGTLIETTLARRWARVRVHVHAERGMELADLRSRGWRKSLRGRTTRWALDRCDAVVAVAEAIRENLTDRCGKLRREVEVIPNGVDAPAPVDRDVDRRKLREALGISDTSFVVGSVGRLAAVKNFGCAIAAIAKLVDDSQDVHLVLVGDGGQRTELSRQCEEAQLQDRVHFVGQQSDVSKWLSAMDLYVNVSLNEGMSQSIIEAMASGLPMVVTDVGDNGLLAGGQEPCGLVVSADDHEAVAEAIGSIIRQSELRNDLAANGLQRYCRQYNIDQMIDAYHRLYGRWAAIEPVVDAAGQGRFESNNREQITT